MLKQSPQAVADAVELDPRHRLGALDLTGDFVPGVTFQAHPEDLGIERLQPFERLFDQVGRAGRIGGRGFPASFYPNPGAEKISEPVENDPTSVRPGRDGWL